MCTNKTIVATRLWLEEASFLMKTHFSFIKGSHFRLSLIGWSHSRLKLHGWSWNEKLCCVAAAATVTTFKLLHLQKKGFLLFPLNPSQLNSLFTKHWFPAAQSWKSLLHPTVLLIVFMAKYSQLKYDISHFCSLFLGNIYCLFIYLI